MKQYYECHITFTGDALEGEAAVKYVRWKWSHIAGDPIMGAGVRQYATMHYNVRKDKDWIWQRMQDIRTFLDTAGLPVSRCKIEVVLMDERY